MMYFEIKYISLDFIHWLGGLEVRFRETYFINLFIYSNFRTEFIICITYYPSNFTAIAFCSYLFVCFFYEKCI
jgi:hypothetical protein